MPRTAAEMVELYTEAIARKLDPTLGDGVKKAGDSSGINTENYSLEELEAGLARWKREAATEASTTGSIQLSTITTVPVDNAAECE